MTLSLKSTCPYCGRENIVEAEVDSAGSTHINAVVTCDCEEGGCDCDYVVSTVVTVEVGNVRSRKIEGEDAKFSSYMGEA